MCWASVIVALVVGSCVGCAVMAVVSAGNVDAARRWGYLCGRLDERAGLPEAD